MRKLICGVAAIALATVFASAQPSSGGGGGGVTRSVVTNIVISLITTGGISTTTATNISAAVTREILIASNALWVARLNGNASNLTQRASSATTVASTIQPFIGGTADWFRINSTNGSMLHRVDSNGVWRFGLDTYFNNGIDVSGAFTGVEGTFSGALIANDTATFNNTATFKATDSGIATTLQPLIGGSVDWARWLATNGTTLHRIDSNGVWRFGLDTYFNNGVDISGALTGVEATFTGAFIASDTAEFNGSLLLPDGVAPTTDAFGEIAADNNAWAASRGAVQFFDGTANTFLVGALAADTPSDGQVPKWNADGTITWEDDDNDGGVGADFYGQNVVTNLQVASTTGLNASLILSNSAADGFANVSYYHGPAAPSTSHSFDTVVGSNTFRLFPGPLTSFPPFLTMDKAGRSLMLGYGGDASVNTISNKANTTIQSNLVVNGTTTLEGGVSLGGSAGILHLLTTTNAPTDSNFVANFDAGNKQFWFPAEANINIPHATNVSGNWSTSKVVSVYLDLRGKAFDGRLSWPTTFNRIGVATTNNAILSSNKIHRLALENYGPGQTNTDIAIGYGQ